MDNENNFFKQNPTPELPPEEVPIPPILENLEQAPLSDAQIEALRETLREVTKKDRK